MLNITLLSIAILDPYRDYEKTLGLTQKIFSGEKTIETRWYNSRRAPWGRIQIEEKVYFKDAGAPVTVVAQVAKVDQYEKVDESMRKKILAKYGSRALGTCEISDEIACHTRVKRYCVAVHLKNPRKVKPFEIDKRGFGAMTAWLCVEEEKFPGIRIPNV